MSSPAFQRRMSQLALVAMLLLLALPTAGRIAMAMAAGAAGPTVAEGRWIELCTVAGRTLAFLDVQGRITHGDGVPFPPDDPLRGPTHPHDGDLPGTECDYCPLLGGLALHWPRVAPSVARTSSGIRRPAVAVPPRSVLLPGGPGSRGPPSALRTG